MFCLGIYPLICVVCSSPWIDKRPGDQEQGIIFVLVFYANREIHLLDDPLPAVNAHVGKLILEQGIKAALKYKIKINKNNTVGNASTTGD